MTDDFASKKITLISFIDKASKSISNISDEDIKNVHSLICECVDEINIKLQENEIAKEKLDRESIELKKNLAEMNTIHILYSLLTNLSEPKTTNSNNNSNDIYNSRFRRFII